MTHDQAVKKWEVLVANKETETLDRIYKLSQQHHDLPFFEVVILFFSQGV